MTKKIKDPRVALVFKEYPVLYRKKLLILRQAILEVSEELKEYGEVEETLKWGEPSYLMQKSRIGTTVRIHWLKSKSDQFGIYFNCQTTLVQDFKRKFPGQFQYEGKRAIIFKKESPLHMKSLKECIRMALTYYLRT